MPLRHTALSLSPATSAARQGTTKRRSPFRRGRTRWRFICRRFGRDMPVARSPALGRCLDQLAPQQSSDSRLERRPPPRPAAAAVPRNASWPSQRHTHGPRLAGPAAAPRLSGAPSRALCTGLPGISSRRLLAQPCGRRSQRHQLAVRATHPGHHLGHHGGLVAVAAAPPSAQRLPLAFPAGSAP